MLLPKDLLKKLVKVKSGTCGLSDDVLLTGQHDAWCRLSIHFVKQEKKSLISVTGFVGREEEGKTGNNESGKKY